MTLAGIPNTIWALVFSTVFSLAGWVLPATAADEPASAVATSNPIEQALSDLKSEDAEVRSKAVVTLIEKGDASLIPKLDEIRAEADRATRQAI